jgi:myb proto-oncogene protein
MKKSIIYISSMLLAGCVHASFLLPQDNACTCALMKGIRKNRAWTLEEDETIEQWVKRNGPNNWAELARLHLPHREPEELKRHWDEIVCVVFRNRAWTSGEDGEIEQWVQKHGPRNWAEFATKSLPGRDWRSCKERWENHLNPDVVYVPWTPEEDRVLVQLHNEYGNRWTEITFRMPNRTNSQIKNRLDSIGRTH